MALPGTLTGLSSPVFAEAMAAHLCLGSPAVNSSGRVGGTVGRRGAVIDQFGDAVLNCRDIPDDSWRHRHDTVKLALVAEMLASKVTHDCEVYGLFADLLPAAAQGEGEALQWGRARQGLVPDFRIHLPTPEGPTDHLAELKVIGAGATWYPRGVEGRRSDRRAEGLNRLYRRNPSKSDEEISWVY